MYATTFTVTGSLPFPLDMLRYDRCHPATSDDAANIERTNDERTTGPVVINLVVYHRTRQLSLSRITVDRWRSFGWGCDAVNTTTTKAE